MTVNRWTVSTLCALGATGIFLASSAAGQTCTPPATSAGADVIVGEITGPANYSANGGLEAFSLGTYSCNIGNVWLNWFADTNQHPVIGGTLYKMKQRGTAPNTYWTFEQIGQSWLKHGFFALSDNLCCNNCSPTDGTHLGVHCADPYTAARNGDQGPLGPKWQVNATTGAFTYPPASPSFSGTTARRLQVQISELEVSSATVLYFGGTMYTTPDEPPVNRFNNQSYRRANISGSGTAWTMALTSSTQRAQAGIRAWADNDTGVTEKEMYVTESAPYQGLYVLAAKATDLGDGTWHYEYAVQNYNSDRSAQAITIPVPAGVQLTNAGFHDVDYHNGDGQGSVTTNGADWTMTVGSGTVTWATQTFAENPNANALRWDTLYNFRFDANTPPVAGGAPVTLTLFKPGTPTSITAFGIAAPGAPTIQPGDVDGDGDVDLGDLAALLASFGLCSGETGYDDGADFDGSNCVDLADLATLLANFGS